MIILPAEKSEDKNSVTAPCINVKKLNYIEDSYDIYVNLFEIHLTKDIIIYQYPFTLVSEIEPEDIFMLKKIFTFCLNDLK